jgi:cytochrome c biogenesis protein CcmG/thiol:disulfide interchange protein DsbE
VISYRGKPVFLDVWASWCVPCREEAPMLARLFRAYGRRIQFVGLDMNDGRSDARAFIRRSGLSYPHVFDAKATLATRLKVLGLPTAFLVDARGRVAAVAAGKQKEEALRHAFDALIGETTN